VLEWGLRGIGVGVGFLLDVATPLQDHKRKRGGSFSFLLDTRSRGDRLI
jgi:hypothetical protein